MLGLVRKRFSKLRNKSRLTQSQMADYLGVDQNYISKCEKGECQFSLDILEKAATLFGYPVEYLIDESSKIPAVPVVLKTKTVGTEDLKALAAMNKIALNLRFMDGLLGKV